jgi:hypothetical protein
MRQSGQSTRLLDQYIQEFFTKGSVRVIDHHGTRDAHRLLLEKFIKRLHAEHRGVLYRIDVKDTQRVIKRDHAG